MNLGTVVCNVSMEVIMLKREFQLAILVQKDISVIRLQLQIILFAQLVLTVHWEILQLMLSISMIVQQELIALKQDSLMPQNVLHVIQENIVLQGQQL